MFEVVRYTAEKEAEWNHFVAESKNGTFLFDRRFMDYHADRFCDYSLMFYRDGRLYALLPGNVADGTFYSHQGLTYGGLVMGVEATTVHVMEIFELFNRRLKDEGITRVVYKAVPWIYHTMPAEEPLYAMFRHAGCRLLERDISTTIVLNSQLTWKKDRRHGLKVARQRGVLVSRSDDYAAFWDILTENLKACHGVRPVHSLTEILLLRDRFPQQIQLYAATLDGQMVGGCVFFVMKHVVHTQYIAATPEGKRMGAVDAIIRKLVDEMQDAHEYLDFGKSTETHSDQLNAQLIYQKEGFGGRAVCYDTYEYEL